MTELAVYGSQGDHVAGQDFRGGGKMAEKGFFAGLKFYAEMSGRNVKYHCFFRGRPTSSSRSEQYFVEYKGELEGFKELANQVKKAMKAEFDDFVFAKEQEDDFLYDLVGVRENNFDYSAEEISRELGRNNQIEFVAGSNKSAASLIDFLMDVETHSSDNHATIGLADNFREIEEPEIAIKLDKSARRVKSPTLDTSTSNSTNQTSNEYNRKYSHDKPSGPVEWVKSLMPFN